MNEPPWLPRTEEEYRQQVAEDAGPSPDEMTRLQMDIDSAEDEIERLRNALTSAASSIHDSHRQSPENTIETCRAIICENNWAALQGEHVG